jgi:hypothetical protein
MTITKSFLSPFGRAHTPSTAPDRLSHCSDSAKSRRADRHRPDCAVSRRSRPRRAKATCAHAAIDGSAMSPPTHHLCLDGMDVAHAISLPKPQITWNLEEEANWGLDFVNARQSVAAARAKGITVSVYNFSCLPIFPPSLIMWFPPECP